MPHFISIQNLQDAGLDIYARLSEVQLLRYREPKPGIFIAESPIVVERALAAGYRPISVLMDEAGVPKQQGLLKVCGEIPVYTARFDVLTQITGFKLTRGMLCAMERNELPQADILCRDMYRIAVLEDVMNPTNVGAIFRSAAALGMDALLSHTRTTLQLTAVLVGLCFFSSMVITNDVSLLTFVPFTFVVVNSLDAAVRDKLLLPIVCMQTIAANLGSMLTPLGNPQNLYLYGKSGMDMGSFVLLMLPYSILSLALLALWAVGLCRRGAKISMAHSAAAASPNKALLSLYSILFVLCLLVVLRVLPYGIAFAAVLACVLLADRNTLCRVDYSLILTFVTLFIFIGNLGRFAAFSGWLQHILTGHEVWVSVLASQVTSNVPAAILLSGFTENIRSLIIGTNLGGLGTLIASMASLISYREIAREFPLQKGRYFALFTVSNILFVTVLMGAWALAG